jgi:hypothetical protein
MAALLGRSSGFESPFGMGSLATVDWLNTKGDVSVPARQFEV